MDDNIGYEITIADQVRFLLWLDSKISDDGERRMYKSPLKDIYRTSMSQRYLVKPQKALGDK